MTKLLFQLQHLLKIEPGAKGARRVQEIALDLGETVFKVEQIIFNRATHANLGVLTKLMLYCIRNGLATETELCSDMLTFEPNEFGRMLKQKHIHFCKGVRPDQLGRDSYVSAHDVQLEATLVEHITAESSPVGKAGSQQHAIDIRLIPSWRVGVDVGNALIEKRARQLRRSLYGQQVGSLLACLGSMKSNSVNEIVIAESFAKAKAFRSEDDKSTPNKRSVPFYFRFRNEDPCPPSCAGGLQLSKDQEGTNPGLYYEEKPGEEWAFIPCDEKTDAALVMYRFHKSSKSVELVAGGFSGRGTFGLSEVLRHHSRKFWPATYVGTDLLMGVFVIRLEFKQPKNKVDAPTDQGDELIAHDVIAPAEQGYELISHDVIPLTIDVLRKRIGGSHSAAEVAAGPEKKAVGQAKNRSQA